MAYPNQNYYANPYQPNIQAPMSQLEQLRQPYQMTQVTQMPQMMAPQPQINSGILWVQGEQAAKSYLVAPGSSVLLMDSDSSNFYIKTVDGAGMPQPLRVFRYEEVGNNALKQQEHQIPDPAQFVTRQEYDDLIEKYNTIINRLESIPAETKKTANRVKNSGGNADE